jgi:hypothetical protein
LRDPRQISRNVDADFQGNFATIYVSLTVPLRMNLEISLRLSSRKSTFQHEPFIDRGIGMTQIRYLLQQRQTQQSIAVKAALAEDQILGLAIELLTLVYSLEGH